MFRFPLRTPAGAGTSDIKRTPCSVKDMLLLFDGFRQQLPSALLFLKSVKTVSIFVSARSDAPAHLLCRAHASSHSDAKAGLEPQAQTGSSSSLQEPITK